MEADGEGVLDIAAFLGRRRGSLARADMIEDAFEAALAAVPAEEVGEVESTAARATGPGGGPGVGPPSSTAGPGASVHILGGVPETVVGFTFFGVAEDVVGLFDLFELSFGVGGVFGEIGVILACEAPIRLFDLVRRGVAGHLQDVVIVSLGHKLP